MTPADLCEHCGVTTDPIRHGWDHLCYRAIAGTAWFHASDDVWWRASEFRNVRVGPACVDGRYAICGDVPGEGHPVYLADHLTIEEAETAMAQALLLLSGHPIGAASDE